MVDALVSTTTTSTRLLWDPPPFTLDILHANKNGKFSHRTVRISTPTQLLYNINIPTYQVVNTSSRGATTVASSVCTVALP